MKNKSKPPHCFADEKLTRIKSIRSSHWEDMDMSGFQKDVTYDQIKNYIIVDQLENFLYFAFQIEQNMV